jgi:hypothetical protein
MKLKALIFYIIISISGSSLFAQKNALTVRPFNFVESLFGLTYERHIAGNFSIALYGEYSDGPQILWNGFNNAIKNSITGASSADFRYKGWGVMPEVRYYFKERDKNEPEVVLVNEGKIKGWFVGAYIPFRKIEGELKIETVELYAFANQRDQGVLTINKSIYGLGVLGGRHWVWGLFSFEIQAGLAVTNGLSGFFNNTSELTYTRNGIGQYEVSKNLGGFGTYMILQPRLGLSMGIGF